MIVDKKLTKVGDIISAYCNPKNSWEVLDVQETVVTVKSLISGRITTYDPNADFFSLTPYEEFDYDYKTDKKIPKPYGKEIKNTNDLLALAAHYKVLF